MEQPIPQLTRRMTEQEYLRFEELAKERHEFRDGVVVDMAGGTGTHAGIISNLHTAIATRLKDSGCKVYGSDLRVRINELGNYYYPDLLIVCGPLQYANPTKQTTIINPRVIIEVLSSGTEADDRGQKFTDYRRIESIEEYVLISQHTTQVETYYRKYGNEWTIGPNFHKADSQVIFRSLKIEIPVGEIYAGIELPPSAVQESEPETNPST